MGRLKFGARGEWWVVGQFILVPVILAATWLTRAPAGWPGALRWLGAAAGLACLVLAATFALGGILHLGRNLTTVPRPIDDGHLVQEGLYRVVRHPIYAGVIWGCLGFTLLANSLPGVALAGVVFAYFDQKSRREERWLAERYPAYPAYRQRVRKLIPWLY